MTVLLKLWVVVALMSLCTISKASEDEHRKVIDDLNHALRLCSVHIDSAEHFLDSVFTHYTQEKDTYAQIRTMAIRAYIYCFDSRYEEGLLSAYKALELQDIYGKDSLSYGIIYLNMGLPLDGFGRTEEAIEKTKLALEYFEKFGEKTLIDKALNNLGAFNNSIGRNRDALPYYRRSAQIRKELEQFYLLGYSYFNMASVYSELQEKDSFARYILLSRDVFAGIEGARLPAMVKFLLAQHYVDIDSIDKALSLTEEGISHSEKIGNTEMVVLGLKQASELYEQTGEYQKAYEFLDRYDSLSSVLDSINSAERIAQYEKRSERAEAEARIEKANADRLEAESRSIRLQWILTIIVLISVILFGVGYTIYQRKQREVRLQSAQLQTELEQTKLMALRSQMNPHFIFNSIHLAQSYILVANKEKAYEYLEKFAKLLRLMLNNSMQMYIPLEDEIRQLSYYLSLEKDRFEGKFEYTVQVEEELEQSLYEIPGMLIQPFVENALIHGVLNRADGSGKILLELHRNGNMLECIIEDNGVGRLAAQKIKENKERKFRSVATYNIDHRIEILSRLLDEKISYRIVDLVDSEGKSAGTRVEVEIPLM